MASALNGKPTPPDPARATLAEAIARRNELARQLDASRDAAERAAHSRWAAMGRLDALRQAKAEAAAAQSAGTRFIASVAAGEPCGIDVLERQVSPADLDAAEREIEVWTRTQSECAALITEREQKLERAGFRVERMAHEVVKASGTVTRLLDGLDALHAELEQRLSVLHFLDIRGVIPDPEQPEVGRAIGWMHRGHDHTHPAYKAWAAAIEALSRDAGAKLPGE